MSESKLILIIEDEVHIADLLQINLEIEGYTIQTTESGIEGLKIIQQRKVDMVILDVMLPDANGVDLCRKIKNIRNNLPVLMLSALGQSGDRIKGLKSGADDYLAKPFNLEELLLRIEKLLKRFGDNYSQKSNQNIVQIGQAKIDFAKMHIENENEEYYLTLKEGELLKYMIEKKNVLLSRQMILEEVWGYDQYPHTRTIDNFISNLRKYIEPNPNEAKFIRTVRGKGYMLVI